MTIPRDGVADIVDLNFIYKQPLRRNNELNLYLRRHIGGA